MKVGATRRLRETRVTRPIQIDVAITIEVGKQRVATPQCRRDNDSLRDIGEGTGSIFAIPRVPGWATAPNPHSDVKVSIAVRVQHAHRRRVVRHADAALRLAIHEGPLPLFRKVPAGILCQSVT
jgi:hypothetical protein